jgi:hypothetical protein
VAAKSRNLPKSRARNEKLYLFIKKGDNRIKARKTKRGIPMKKLEAIF